MTSDGTYTAVVDRFENGLAVLLLEADGETVGERTLDRTRLPEDGRHVDAVLRVEVRDGDVAGVSSAPEESAQRSERVRRRFDGLSSRPPSTDDEDDPGSASN